MYRILIIDDDLSELTALSEMIAEWGYHAETARSVAEARRIVQQEGDRFHAVLLDWRLPDGDGVEVLRWIKESSAGRQLEVIIQSTTVVPGEIRRGISQGAYYFLTKPYSGPQLLALLRAAISSHELQHKLRRASCEIEDCFGLLDRGRFRIRTIADAELLSAHIGSASGDPQCGIGVLELLINGIEHGNLGITYDEKSELLARGAYEAELTRRLEAPEHRDKIVTVDLERADDALELTIRDCGTGFDFQRFLSFDKERFFDRHGRGVLLAHAALELEYLHPGNEVRVRVPLADRAPAARETA